MAHARAGVLGPSPWGRQQDGSPGEVMGSDESCPSEQTIGVRVERGPDGIGFLEPKRIAGIKGRCEPTTLVVTDSSPVLVVSVTTRHPSVENDVTSPNVETRQLLKVRASEGRADTLQRQPDSAHGVSQVPPEGLHVICGVNSREQPIAVPETLVRRDD